jgi:hypothetical protein
MGVIPLLRDELIHHTTEHGIALGGYFWLTTAVR